MKIIHVDIKNDEGDTECYEATGGLFKAIMTLFAIWRYGEGQIQIRGENE